VKLIESFRSSWAQYPHITVKEQSSMLTAKPLVRAAIVAVVATHFTVAPSTASERFSLKGDDVAIFNLVGSVAVESGAGPGVVVEVARAGKDAAALAVETEPKGLRQTLRVRYPGKRIVYEGLGRGSHSALQVRPDGTFDDDGFKSFGGYQNRVTVAGSGSGIEAHANLSVRVPEGQKVSIYMVAGKVSVTNVAGEIYVENGTGTIITSRTRGWLRLDSGSGSVRVNHAQGDVYLDNGSGNIEVSDIRGKRLAVESGSGHIDISQIHVDELDVESGSGGVEVASLDAPEIQIDIGSGGLKLDLASDIRSLAVDAGSGDVAVRIPEHLGAELDVSTGSGGIEITVPCEISTRERHHIRGRIGDGEGKFRIDSGSGAVTISRNGVRATAGGSKTTSRPAAKRSGVSTSK
jgi:lia operon protein LiaG